MGAERQVLAALALMGALILDQCQLKFKENQDAGAITEVAVLKVNGSIKIRDLYRGYGKFQKTECIRIGAKGELKIGGALWGYSRSE